MRPVPSLPSRIKAAFLFALVPTLLFAQDFSDKSITNPMNKALDLVIVVGTTACLISGVGLLIKAALSEERARWFWLAFGSFIIGAVLGNIRGIMSWFA